MKPERLLPLWARLLGSTLGFIAHFAAWAAKAITAAAPCEAVQTKPTPFIETIPQRVGLLSKPDSRRTRKRRKSPV